MCNHQLFRRLTKTEWAIDVAVNETDLLSNRGAMPPHAPEARWPGGTSQIRIPNDPNEHFGCTIGTGNGDVTCPDVKTMTLDRFLSVRGQSQ
ncbi:MAG: hypothetical protein JWQ43_172 [Glaciihabitans sp.]|nr:hypothetical protein [Glaciihabitans sp.]